MQQFLTGKHRLPGFHRPWTPTKIAALGSFRKGKGLSRDQVGTEGLPCVLYGDLYTKYDHTVRNLTSFIPAELADSSQPIHTGDLLFTASGETAEEIGKCVAYLGEADAYAGGDVLILTPRKDDSEYLGYVLNHAAVIRQRVRVAQGHSVVHITAKHLGSISIELPDRQEQCALASLIADADRVTRNYVEQRDRLVTERESLLQQLLTGKWRVKAGDGAESLHAAR
jgi:type I restriction enzyme S subunit